MKQGVSGVKMKVGTLGIHEDVARVKAVREAIGPKALLMLDANCAYSSHRAAQFARQVEEYDIYCLEEPVVPHDYDEVWHHAFNYSLETDREGRLLAPERPGIGFEPDYRVLDRCRII